MRIHVENIFFLSNAVSIAKNEVMHTELDFRKLKRAAQYILKDLRGLIKDLGDLTDSKTICSWQNTNKDFKKIKCHALALDIGSSQDMRPLF